MNKVRGGVAGLALIGLLAVFPKTGVAGEFHATPEQRQACRSDYFRFCFGLSPTSDAVVACLGAKKSQLSPACRALFH